MSNEAIMKRRLEHLFTPPRFSGPTGHRGMGEPGVYTYAVRAMRAEEASGLSDPILVTVNPPTPGSTATHTAIPTPWVNARCMSQVVLKTHVRKQSSHNSRKPHNTNIQNSLNLIRTS